MIGRGEVGWMDGCMLMFDVWKEDYVVYERGALALCTGQWWKPRRHGDRMM